jgi:two-component system, OmpR family, sensor histidine kinase BaeS
VITAPPPPDAPARRLPSPLPDRRPVVAAGAIGALLIDLTLFHGIGSIAGTMLVGGLAIWLGRQSSRRWGAHSACVTGIATLGLLLPMRSAWWLLTFNVAMIVMLSCIAMFLSTSGPRWAMTTPIAALALGLIAPAAGMFLVPRLGDGRVVTRARRHAPGLLVGALVLFVFLVAPSSADAVLRSYLDSMDDLRWPVHLAAVGLGAMVVLAIRWCRDLEREPVFLEHDRAGISAATALWTLISVTVALVAYAGARVAAMLGGDDYVRERTGLTYAEYARAGFFQLLVVACVVILVVHALARRSRRHRVLGVTISGLTLTVIAAAINGLALYQDVFGATVLRWLSTSFAIALGVGVFVLVASLFGRSGARWFPTALGAVLVAWLIGLNLAHPEARIAEINLARAADGLRYDEQYLLGLSDDAAPALLAADDEWLVNALCSRTSPTSGLLDFNWGSNAADDARAAVCAAG